MARVNHPRVGVAPQFGESATAPESSVDVDMDKISSKFGWDHKCIIWEILNMSVAVGRGGGHPDANNLNLEADPSDPQEYACLLDIDYMTTLPFQAGHHDQNKSTWSLSFYKTSPEYLGLFMHLIEQNTEDDGGESGVNRRFHHNHSFDDYNHGHAIGHQGQGLYLKYAMSVVSSEGEVVHKIENDSIINILPGQSWGEEDFILLSHLWDPASKLLDSEGQEKLIVRVDLWLFSQLNHVHEVYPPSPGGSVACESHPQNLQSAGFSKNKSTSKFARLQNKLFGFVGPSSSRGGEGEGSKSRGILDALWTQKEFTDVQIRCGDKTFAVHKCIISAASPVFKTMFSTAMSESLENVVTLHDLDPGVLEALLSFMYNQALPPWWDWGSLEKSAELVNASEKYELKELKGLAFGALCEKLDLGNAPGVAVLAQVYGADAGVKEFVARFIIRNMRRLKLEPSFLELVNNHPAAFAGILLSDALSKSVSTTCL